MISEYDVLIIGGGQGAALARYLARDGKRVALFERGHLGGVCINVGCTPTKALIASAHAAHMARRGAEFGVRTGEISIDWPSIRARMESIISEFRGEVTDNLDLEDFLTTIHGAARFVGPKTVEANGEQYTAETIVVAVGSHNTLPPISNLEKVPFLDSTRALKLDQIPSHLMIVGGGYIALEVGQSFQRLGAQVSVVQDQPHVLPGEDADIAEKLMGILAEEGMTFYTCASGKSAHLKDDEIVLHIARGEEQTELRGSHLLIAVGRTPNTENLGCDLAGIELDDAGYIKVDDGLKTTAEGVYAMGDVANSPMFVHIAFDDVRLLHAHLRDGSAVSTKERLVPYAVFTDPQLGRVGLTEAEARKKFGDKIRVASLDAGDTARGIETLNTRGVFKAVVGPDDEILGVAIMSAEGGETMSAVHAAMIAKRPYTALRDASWAHPLWSEALNRLFLKMDADVKTG